MFNHGQPQLALPALMSAMGVHRAAMHDLAGSMQKHYDASLNGSMSDVRRVSDEMIASEQDLIVAQNAVFDAIDAITGRPGSTLSDAADVLGDDHRELFAEAVEQYRTSVRELIERSEMVYVESLSVLNAIGADVGGVDGYDKTGKASKHTGMPLFEGAL